MITDVHVLPVHLEFFPEVQQALEQKCSDWFSRAADIFSLMKISNPTVVALRKRLTHNLGVVEKDKIRDGLKREVATALESDVEIPYGVIDNLTKVLVNMAMEDIELVSADFRKSIVLHLRCLSLISLLRLREMIVSGLLLRLLIEVIKHFLESRPRVQLVVRAEDFNKCLSGFYTATGMSECFCLTVNFLTANYIV